MNKLYSLTEVQTRIEKDAFLSFPAKLYKDDPFYVRPFDIDVQKLFDPGSNKLLRKGEAIRWLLYDQNRNIVGRIAAFIDVDSARNNDQPTGGCGFFDCINDQPAANELFTAAKIWLEERGMEAMDGSINFGDRDNFWGVLVDGFHEPIFNMPYNFPYYKELFENFGFRNYFNQYTFKREISMVGVKDIIKEKAERVSQNPDYHFRMINWNHIDKYAVDFLDIYNKAWGVIPGSKKLTIAHAKGLLNKMKPILDPRLVYFGYYQDQPIAFFIMMQDLNQIIYRFKGKLNLFNKLRLMYHLKIRKDCTRVVGRIFGIVPEHQGKGIDGALIMTFSKVASSPGFPYKDIEMNWIGDFNPSMIKIVENIGGYIHKTHVTYRYLFDRNKPFVRAKIQE